MGHSSNYNEEKRYLHPQSDPQLHDSFFPDLHLQFPPHAQTGSSSWEVPEYMKTCPLSVSNWFDIALCFCVLQSKAKEINKTR